MSPGPLGSRREFPGRDLVGSSDLELACGFARSKLLSISQGLFLVPKGGFGKASAVSSRRFAPNLL
jgi:hypothetical protein